MLLAPAVITSAISVSFLVVARRTEGGGAARRAGGGPVYAAAVPQRKVPGMIWSFWSHSPLMHFQAVKGRPLFFAVCSRRAASRPHSGQVGRPSPELTADGGP